MTSSRIVRPRLEELEGRVVMSATMVKDIDPGAPGSYPDRPPYLQQELNINGTLFFNARDNTHGYELWKSDGSAAGTVLVKDIQAGQTGSYPQQFANVNGELYFRADNGVNGTELWKSDGTAAGTVLVDPSGSFQLPKYLTNVNGTLFFTAHGADGGELWKTNGTAAGTVMVKDLNVGGFSNTRYLTNVSGTLFFRATDGKHGYELWKSDGTAGGTVMVKDIYPGFGSAYPGFLTNVNGELFFQATDGDTADGFELWKSNGTAGGTVMVKDINPGLASSTPKALTNANGTLFFSAEDSSGTYELWKSDGSAAGTVMVSSVTPNPLNAFTNIGGTVYFGSEDDAFWKSDGTTAGTVEIANNSPTNITNVNGLLFFAGVDVDHGKELWQSNGTPAGTFVSDDIVPGQLDASPNTFINVNGKLFFNANDGVHGEELWTATPSVAPRVLSAVFSGTSPGTFDKVELTFSEAIDANEFTTSQVSLTGPGGSVPLTVVSPVSGTNNVFDVLFPNVTQVGTYTITVGPNVDDLAGDPMDQNQNGINGEAGAAPTGDAFVANGLLGGFPTAISAVGGADGTVRIINENSGAVLQTVRPLDAGTNTYNGLVSVALGDFNADGVPDLVVAAANPSGVDGLPASKAGKVFVFDGSALAGGALTLVHTFTPFANTDGPVGTTGAYINGLNIAIGDVNGDGKADLVAGTRGGTATAGKVEFGRIIVVSAGAATNSSSDTFIGSTVAGVSPFGATYTKGVVVAAGNLDGTGGDEIAVTRGGPVAATNPNKSIKLKAYQLVGTSLIELNLSGTGSPLAPFDGIGSGTNVIDRDARVTFTDGDGDGKAELVFSALDRITNPSNVQVRIAVFTVNTTSGLATPASTGTGPSKSYLEGTNIVDHAIGPVTISGDTDLVLLTQTQTGGVIQYLFPLTGDVVTGGFGLDVVTGGITIDGI